MRLPSPLLNRRAAAALVAVVGGLVFANSLLNGFAWDDEQIVVLNTRLHELGSLPGALALPYWPGTYGRELGLWRPTTTALLGLQHVISGGAPLLFHAVNVAGHALVSALVLLLLAELMPLGGALAGALVFAVHPVHVEAVANVIGVAEIVSTAALLGACLIHVRSGPGGRWGSPLAIGLLFAFGFGAKESAITLPGILFLIDAARRRIGFSDLRAYLRDEWRTYAVLGGTAAALLAGRFAVLGSLASPLGPLGADLLQEIPRIWTLAEVWTHYVRLWVFPLDLVSDYAPNVIPISLGWHATNGVGVLLAMSILVVTWVAWRRPQARSDILTARMAAFGVLWFVITISPVSNTVFLAGVLLAERTLYLPSVGLAAATGWLVARLARDRPRGAWIALGLALSLATARTWTRSPTWADTGAVITALVSQYPQSGRSQWILGDAFLGTGRESEALRAYRAAIDVLGTHYQVVTEISRQLIAMRRYRAAEVLASIAARNDPRYPLAWGMLAFIRAEYGDPEGTERYARLSLERHEVDATRHHLLAWALAAQGRWPEASEARARGLEQAPARFWHMYMYEAYVRRENGDTAGAFAAIDTAWAFVASDVGRATLDSVRVSEFGLESLLAPDDSADSGANTGVNR
jgi:tetratricopeptide (TPR) repeat protein